MTELREKIADIVAERMFAADVRAKAQYELADRILEIPELAEALKLTIVDGHPLQRDRHGMPTAPNPHE